MENTIFKLVVKKPKYTPKTKFKTWLYTIARNEANDYIRKNNKYTKIQLDDLILKSEEIIYLKNLILMKNMDICFTSQIMVMAVILILKIVN